jgi:hypothetical protein
MAVEIIEFEITEANNWETLDRSPRLKWTLMENGTEVEQGGFKLQLFNSNTGADGDYGDQIIPDPETNPGGWLEHLTDAAKLYDIVGPLRVGWYIGRVQAFKAGDDPSDVASWSDIDDTKFHILPYSQRSLSFDFNLEKTTDRINVDVTGDESGLLEGAPAISEGYFNEFTSRDGIDIDSNYERIKLARVSNNTYVAGELVLNFMTAVNDTEWFTPTYVSDEEYGSSITFYGVAANTMEEALAATFPEDTWADGATVTGRYMRLKIHLEPSPDGRVPPHLYSITVSYHTPGGDVTEQTVTFEVTDPTDDNDPTSFINDFDDASVAPHKFEFNNTEAVPGSLTAGGGVRLANTGIDKDYSTEPGTVIYRFDTQGGAGFYTIRFYDAQDYTAATAAEPGYCGQKVSVKLYYRIGNNAEDLDSAPWSTATVFDSTTVPLKDEVTTKGFKYELDLNNDNSTSNPAYNKRFLDMKFVLLTTQDDYSPKIDRIEVEWRPVVIPKTVILYTKRFLPKPSNISKVLVTANEEMADGCYAEYGILTKGAKTNYRWKDFQVIPVNAWVHNVMQSTDPNDKGFLVLALKMTSTSLDYEPIVHDMDIQVHTINNDIIPMGVIKEPEPTT